MVKWVLKLNKWLKSLFERKEVDLKTLKRPVDKIIIHCAATPPDMDIGVKEIKQWHKQKGWSDIGYHYVIRHNGVIEDGRPVNRIGAHVAGHNKGSIGICLVGGVDHEGHAVPNFTDKQWRTLEQMVRSLKTQLPRATIHGHNEFANKSCPSFIVQNWLQSKNI